MKMTKKSSPFTVTLHFDGEEPMDMPLSLEAAKILIVTGLRIAEAPHHSGVDSDARTIDVGSIAYDPYGAPIIIDGIEYSLADAATYLELGMYVAFRQALERIEDEVDQ